MAILLTAFVLGLIVGLVLRGVNINITHKHEQPKQEKQEYNESLVDLLPSNVKQYYHENSGQNKF
jgi:cell division protein FtsN